MSNASPVADSLERQWPPTLAVDELRLQREFLSFLRITVVNKISGLDTSQAAATPLPTSPFMSLAGVVKHLTAVERFWMSIVGGGSDLPSLWEADDVNADWQLNESDTPSGIVAAYRAEWFRSEQALAGKTAGDRATRSVSGKEYTVRWLLSHVIQETARHVGHMDLLREMADGARGE
ncbi:DinB family protein [Streptomyces sp. NPDC002088]|uniref:DinB family protein n=1 Tax=Streptomyces sp. NPDC002088 TaxID=3154665 RepID=UPI003326E846